jgi:hypothetical protein
MNSNIFTFSSCSYKYNGEVPLTPFGFLEYTVLPITLYVINDLKYSNKIFNLISNNYQNKKKLFFFFLLTYRISVLIDKAT